MEVNHTYPFPCFLLEIMCGYFEGEVGVEGGRIHEYLAGSIGRECVQLVVSFEGVPNCSFPNPEIDSLRIRNWLSSQHRASGIGFLEDHLT